MPQPLKVRFRAGDRGGWAVQQIAAVAGDGLAPAARIDVVEGDSDVGGPAAWVLTGVTSHDRYLEGVERLALRAVQEPLGRPHATCAALIPIRKSEAWWELPQDERRAILERRSHHVAVGLEYLPAIARRLHHCRDLGGEFDFLTWFEFAPAGTTAFDELVGRLRATEEWTYVEREVDVRLSRLPAP